jgi:hypothetical protein
MKKKVIYLSMIFFLLLAYDSFSQDIVSLDQDIKVSELFMNRQVLPLKLSYSNKDIKKNTNDSTYITSDLSYQLADGSWENSEVKLRARGHNRLKNCYYAPIKIKIKKSIAAGTLFEGNKKLKLVLPCLLQKDKNDNVVKEYMAYKLYELITPYHYKTRMVSIDFTEIRGNKTKLHKLKGFLIEDISKTADRHNGNVIDNFIHPLNQDAVCSVQNDFFQYMIGNTDFSIAYQHNEKLLFVDKKVIPVPYDFDMSGLVDASYSVVSVVQNEKLNISDVKQRLYRGFKRDEAFYQKVRKEFLDNKTEMLEIIDRLELHFDDPKEFSMAKNFIVSFFEVMVNDQKFDKNILRKARTK